MDPPPPPALDPQLVASIDILAQFLLVLIHNILPTLVLLPVLTHNLSRPLVFLPKVPATAHLKPLADIGDPAHVPASAGPQSFADVGVSAQVLLLLILNSRGKRCLCSYHR